MGEINQKGLRACDTPAAVDAFFKTHAGVIGADDLTWIRRELEQTL